MKIINYEVSRPARQPRDELELVDDVIRDLQDKIGLQNPSISNASPLSAKYDYFEALLNFAQQYTVFQAAELEAQQQEKHRKSSFWGFTLLPVELRNQIWDHAMASHIRPRVHIIVEINSNFISNQPISPLLHACAESRNLVSPHFMIAYQTYVNFDIDTIYLPTLRPHEPFLRFLECDSTKYLQTLAISKDLCCNIPLPGHFSTNHLKMQACMPVWRETLVIFDGDQLSLDTLLHPSVVFRELSARDQRRSAAVAYARVVVRLLMKVTKLGMEFEFENGTLRSIAKPAQYRPVKYRYMVATDFEEEVGCLSFQA